MGLKHPPIRLLHWPRAWRIIPTLYPEEELYAPIAQRGDWPAIVVLERLTNTGVRQDEGDRRFLRSGDRLPHGKSAYNIGRPFAFPVPSRFSNGTYGVFYAARHLLTAVRERVHHTTRFLLNTSEAPGILRQRVLVAKIRAQVHDLRHSRSKWAAVYREDDYTASQTLGLTLWSAGSSGIAYDSVRHKGGECVAVFSPQKVSHCRQERCLEFQWDGRRVVSVLEIREFLG